MKPDLTITRCPACDRPAHAGATNDHGLCAACAARQEGPRVKLTAERIRELRDRACECRNIDGKGPPIGDADDHAALHDCDVRVYNDCLIALGDNQERFPRPTWLALQQQVDARARLVEVWNAYHGDAP